MPGAGGSLETARENARRAAERKGPAWLGGMPDLAQALGRWRSRRSEPDPSLQVPFEYLYPVHSVEKTTNEKVTVEGRLGTSWPPASPKLSANCWPPNDRTGQADNPKGEASIDALDAKECTLTPVELERAVCWSTCVSQCGRLFVILFCVMVVASGFWHWLTRTLDQMNPPRLAHKGGAASLGVQLAGSEHPRMEGSLPSATSSTLGVQVGSVAHHLPQSEHSLPSAVTSTLGVQTASAEHPLRIEAANSTAERSAAPAVSSALEDHSELDVLSRELLKVVGDELGEGLHIAPLQPHKAQPGSPEIQNSLPQSVPAALPHDRAKGEVRYTSQDAAQEEQPAPTDHPGITLARALLGYSSQSTVHGAEKRFEVPQERPDASNAHNDAPEGLPGRPGSKQQGLLAPKQHLAVVGLST